MPPKMSGVGAGADTPVQQRLSITRHPHAGWYIDKATNRPASDYAPWAEHQSYYVIPASAFEAHAKSFHSFSSDGDKKAVVKSVKDMFPIFAGITYTAASYGDNVSRRSRTDLRRRQVTAITTVPGHDLNTIVAYLFTASHAVHPNEDQRVDDSAGADVDAAIGAGPVAGAPISASERGDIITRRDPPMIMALRTRMTAKDATASVIGIRERKKFNKGGAAGGGGADLSSSSSETRRGRGGGATTADGESDGTPLLHVITTKQWHHVAALYNPMIHRTHETLVADADRRSPYHWWRVFSKEAAIAHMREAGAHPDFLNPDNYEGWINRPPPEELRRRRPDILDEHGVPIWQVGDGGEHVFTYPHFGEYTYQYDPECNDPKVIMYTMFPQYSNMGDRMPVGPELTLARELYNRMLDDDEEKWGPETRVETLSPAKLDVVKTLIGRNLSADSEKEGFTVKHWINRWQANLAVLLDRRDLAGVVVPENGELTKLQIHLVRDQLYQDIQALTKDAIDDFYGSIIRENNISIGIALAAHATWMNEFKSNGCTFSFPVDAYPYDDLTPFGNTTVAKFMGYETAFRCFSAHTIILKLEFAVQSLHKSRGMCLHVFISGEAGGGKSYAMEVAHTELPIDGTSTKITGNSTKAHFTDGSRQLDGRSQYTDEANPKLYGITDRAISSERGLQSASDQGNTPEAATFREMLCSKYITYERQEKDPKTGVSVTRTFYINATSQFTAASNCDVSINLPAPIKSRHLIIVSEVIQRSDVSIAEKLNGRPTADDTRVRDRAVGLFRRDQAALFMLCHLQKAGIIPQVNHTLAGPLVSEMQKALEGRGIIAASEPRPVERLWMIIDTNVMQRALHTVLDGPNRVVPAGEEKTWNWSYVLKVVPLLVATAEDVVFAYTICADEFESPLRHKIAQAFQILEHDAESATISDETISQETKDGTLPASAYKVGGPQTVIEEDKAREEKLRIEKEAELNALAYEPGRLAEYDDAGFSEEVKSQEKKQKKQKKKKKRGWAAPVSTIDTDDVAKREYGITNLDSINFYYFVVHDAPSATSSSASAPASRFAPPVAQQTKMGPLAELLKRYIAPFKTNQARIVQQLHEISASNVNVLDPNPISTDKRASRQRSPVMCWLYNHARTKTVLRISKKFCEDGSTSVVVNCLKEILSTAGFAQTKYIMAISSDDHVYRPQVLDVVINPRKSTRLSNPMFSSPECQHFADMSLGKGITGTSLSSSPPPPPPAEAEVGEEEKKRAPPQLLLPVEDPPIWRRYVDFADRIFTPVGKLVYSEPGRATGYAFMHHHAMWPIDRSNHKYLNHKGEDITRLMQNPEVFYVTLERERRTLAALDKYKFMEYKNAPALFPERTASELESDEAATSDNYAFLLGMMPTFERIAVEDHREGSVVPLPILRSINVKVASMSVRESTVESLRKKRDALDNAVSMALAAAPGDDDNKRRAAARQDGDDGPAVDGALPYFGLDPSRLPVPPRRLPLAPMIIPSAYTQQPTASYRSGAGTTTTSKWARFSRSVPSVEDLVAEKQRKASTSDGPISPDSRKRYYTQLMSSGMSQASKQLAIANSENRPVRDSNLQSHTSIPPSSSSSVPSSLALDIYD